MKRASAVLAGFLGLVFSTASISATPIPAGGDTIHFNSDDGLVSGGNTIYPYYFNIDGSSTLTSMMCLNYNREITLDETWHVAISNIPLDNSTMSVGYRADAWLFSQLGKYSNSDVQYAVWSIFDPTDVASNAAFGTIARQLAATSMQMAQNTGLISSGFYTNYQIYLPTSNTAGWTAGEPQTFVGKAVTPEPGTLMLMGTGFIAVFFLYRGRGFAL